MGAVFIKILNMSLTAGWIVLAVLLVRLLFKKKAPKALFPILWAIVAVRLLCPVTIESNFSLIRNAEPVVGEVLASEEEKAIVPPIYPESTDPETAKQFAKDYENYINSLDNPSEKVVVSVISRPIDTENPEEVDYIIHEIDPEKETLSNEIMNELEAHGSYTETTEEGVTNTYTLISHAMVKEQKSSVYGILGIIWLAGAVAMLLYMEFSYLRVYRKVKVSAPEEKNIRICDSIDSPFILGLVRPKIYLPSDIHSEDKPFVLAHEKAHLKRYDHVWKPLGFLLLSVYWFHPLLWVAYIVLCKDIEFACDEKVIKELGVEQKKAYSTALINCSVSRKMISACPLAFGENGVKGRVKSVLHYKKPAFWIIIASVLVCTVLAVCLLTNPKGKEELPKAGDIITFGSYEQDNVVENGVESIEWIVVDVFDGKATLLSKYGLDAKPYHENASENITWADCTLRSWLNEAFYETAFSESERKHIVSTHLYNYSNATYEVYGGEDTEDKIYLLSIDELYHIFESENGLSDETDYCSKAGVTTATAYAIAQGAWEGKNETGVASPWLLRTPGVTSSSVCRVSVYGELSHEVRNTYSGCALRPAMRISLDSAEYEIVSSATDSGTENTEDIPYTRNGRFVDTVPLSDAKLGYVVEYGTYEQNKDTTDGAEPVEWYVLDVKDDKALLLSKYVLENMPYHERNEEITWKNCTLREWLNGTFYETAFNEEEKQRIATTLLENVWNPWNVLAEYEYTEDKVFLPSMEDMLAGDYFYTEKAPESAAFTFDGYFQTNAERMARGVYEEEQLTHNASGSVNNFNGIPYAAYWLRASSRVEYRSYDEKKENPYLVVAGISIDGSLDTSAYNTLGNTKYDKKGVRPAIWVELGDLDEIAKQNAKKNSTNDKKQGGLFLSSKLPERYEYKEVKEAFLEYLNHQAYLYPAEYPQGKRESTFDVYSTTDSKMKRVYLQVNENGKKMWYLCTPTVYLDEEAPLTILPIDTESVESLLFLGAITHLGTDTIKVPAVKTPEYHKDTGFDATGYKESIALITEELCKYGYLLKDETDTDVIKAEAWISEFDMEKKLNPHAYIIINDAYVYETSFTKYKGLYASFCTDNFSRDFSLQDHFENQVSYIPEEFDGRSIVPLASVEQAQLERVKSCAVLHYVHEPDFSVTITVDGKAVTLPKRNVEIDVQTDIGIAFVPQGTVGDITRYSIYRTTDGGKNWNSVSKNFETKARELAAIELPDEDHVVCYFNYVGATYHSSCYFSEDGGVTWTMPEQADKPKVDFADAAVGTSVIFGSYEQDFDSGNGKEPLEWLVLDRVGDKVLLLSRFCLLSELYDLNEFDSWEDSWVRRYLNEYFYVDAFTPEERKRIAKTANTTPNMTGKELVTEDYVFLLSEKEVLKGKSQDGTPYFKDEAARMTLPTPIRSSACVYSDCESSCWGDINVNWLLRAGEDKMYNSWVNADGTVNQAGDTFDYDTIDGLTRPAIWVDISSLTGGQISKEETVFVPTNFESETSLTETQPPSSEEPVVVSNLPERYNYEEIKTLLSEYLNHQAWLYPSAYPQESYTCSYELYRNANDDKEYVYLKTVIDEKEHWFLFEPIRYSVPESPLHIVEQSTENMRECVETGGVVSIGSDKLHVPDPTKPAYGNTSEEFKQDISSIFSDLRRNGYRDNLKIEAIVSDFDMEKNLYPYVYLIINDSEVFETSFKEFDAEPLQQMYFNENYTKDYSLKNIDGWPDVFDGHGIKPFDSVDPVQLERVKECAIFHQIFVKEKTETFLIDGQAIEIDSPNLGVGVAAGVQIAFLPQEAAAGSVYYNIYRSDDSGKSWRMVAEDFSVAEGGIARILIPEKDTIVCYFNISGTTSQSECYVSEDGGVTWKHAPYASKPNSFTYDPQTSSSVIFGAYEQDGDYRNGKEPLEWLVLERDGDRALLLSKYGIETLLWDRDQPVGAYDVDDLYWMMNREIYEAAFSAEERAALIQMNPIKNESLAEFPWGMTQYPGYTFLLETDDVLYGKSQNDTPYFRTEEARITIPTAFAAQKGAWLDKNVRFTEVAVPWIVTVTGTTDGDFSEVQFARVMPDGSISFEEEAIKDQYMLIRPAIWVDVTKLPKP